MIIKRIKQRKISFIITIFIFLCLYFSNFVYAEDIKDQKNVLIINSYHQGFTWTRNETEGIINTLNKRINDLSISVEYMDWKRYPTNENLQHLIDYFKFKYQNEQIDILIATDDTALRFVLRKRERLFSNAPVVFCGVNQDGITQITAGYKNFTGIIEEVDPTETINMALEINPSLKDVYVLFDNSESGMSTGELVIKKINSMNNKLNTIPLNNLSYDELLKDIRNYDKDGIILVTTYYSDVNGKIVDFEKVSREVSKNSTVPVYHLFDLGLNNGAVGGNMMSGKLQGESAANLANRVLNGEDPDSINVISPKTTRNIFDYQQLIRFNIPLSKIPENSEIINKPFNFFETYKMLVVSILVAFIVLILFISILLFYIKKINRMKKKLADGHEELIQIYEELAASDEELKQQFDELSSVKESLALSEERFRIATDGSNAVIWDIDMSNMQYQFSDRWYELLGYDRDEVDEANGGWKTIIHPKDVLEADIARNDHLQGKTQFYNCEYRMRRKNGEYIWFNVRGKVLKDSNGKNIRFAGSLIDINERKEYEKRLQESYQELETTYEELITTQEELKQQYDEILANHKQIKETEDRLAYLAYHDALTGQPNRLSLYECANIDFFSLSNKNAALLFIDIDNFKYINDTMGHASGDQLISKASERLTSLLKEGCSIYRLSGDEFIIIIQDIPEKEDAEVFASHILAGFKDEFEVLNSVLHISLSIGIVLYPEHGCNLEELLKYADIAMYKAKESGRNRYAVYDQFMKEAFTERVNIEKCLHAALTKNEFELFYQPQLDLKQNKVVGFEALLRWRSPELGFISPLKFIKIAEDTHLIIPLGAWVLRTACAFLEKLHNNGYKDLTISINISMLQLLQTDFNDMVRDNIEFYGLSPDSLELEITETIFMESFEIVGKKLEGLKKLGVRIALDDFGKGYSSLSYLKQLPISTLKIDKSFIDGIPADDENRTLTGHIITIGKNLGMCVIAEGVEKNEQLQYLIQHECDKIQGYLFSKPIPEEEAVKLLENR